MRPANRPSPERGIAVVTALLVLVLVGAIGATLIATTVNERAMVSNVHIARASLLSADAGIRTCQQVLANRARTKLDTLLSNYTGSGLIILTPATFMPSTMTATSTNPPFNATATIVWADTSIRDSAQVYNFRYTITSTGTFGGGGERQVQSSGMLRVSAERASFAQYLLFTDKHTAANGGAIWFTSDASFDGRVHTNGEFRFAYQPEFQDKVSSVNGKAWFYNKNSPVEKAANYNGTIDVPDFAGGFQRGAPAVALPTDQYNQQNAALGLAVTGSPPSNSTINTALGLGSGSGTPPNGIYVVNSGGSVTGGIYIQGNTTRCTMVADTVAHTQTYTVIQGATTKIIVVNPNTNTTTVTTNGVTAAPLTGAPRGITYCNGTMQDLRGPDRVGNVPPPALLDGQQMLVAASGDIIIQRDITMDNYQDGSAVLGLYSLNGNVRVGTSCPSDMYLDAYVMALGGGATGVGQFTVDNWDSGSPRGTFHLRGGMVAQYYGYFYSFNSSGVLQTGYARDFRYDHRGYAPPYFPTTTLYAQTDRPSARTLAWKEL
jgi:Tfp pilus assembly protein PilX